MLSVLVKETKEQINITLIDPETGTDCTIDFVGNYGAFNDGQFEKNQENVYVANQSTVHWWEKVITEKQALDNRIFELIKKHGSSVKSFIEKVNINCDLEDEYAEWNNVLDQKYGKQPDTKF